MTLLDVAKREHAAAYPNGNWKNLRDDVKQDWLEFAANILVPEATRINPFTTPPYVVMRPGHLTGESVTSGFGGKVIDMRTGLLGGEIRYPGPIYLKNPS